MTAPLLDPRPIPVAKAIRVAREQFGVPAEVSPLPGECDANFHVVGADGRQFVLKVMHPEREPALVELQAGALDHLAARDPALGLPRVERTVAGSRYAAVTMADGSVRLAWMLGWVPGVPLADIRPRHGEVLGSLGELLARLDAALADFESPAAHRDLKWDLTRAGWIAHHLDLIGDPARRALVSRCLGEFQSDLLPALPKLRRGVIHGDANDHNILVRVERGQAPVVASLIDFGDMHHGPLVCELAVAATYAALGAAHPLEAMAQVVAGYHATLPLTEAEIALVLPLVAMRLCVSVVNSALRTASGHDDPYVTISEQPAWELLERLAAAPPRLGHYSLRAACGLPPVPHAARVSAWLAAQPAPAHTVLGMDSATTTITFDLSFGSPMLGADPANLETRRLAVLLADAMAEAGAQVGIGRYDEARPLYTAPLFGGGPSPLDERRTVHLGIDLFAPAGTPVLAPLPGEVHAAAFNPAAQDYGGVIVLRHSTPEGDPFYSLYGHLSAASVGRAEIGAALEAGQRLAELGTEEENGGWVPHLHFQLICDTLGLDTDFPGVVRPSARAIYRGLSPDPAPLLGLGTIPPAVDGDAELRERRRVRIGGSVRLSYRRPLTIVRGWRQYLYDADGRAYLDVFNNVPLVGHSHPAVVRAIQRQVALLNTNTRYLHRNLVAYAERLTARMPEPLSVCFLLNSASEANELALRLARAHTGRRDVIVLEHAYHGHTSTLVDISPYKFDGPGGGGRPSWVHVAPIPDDYRGAFRRGLPDRGARYAAQVGALVDQARAAGAPVGAFIAETLPSVGGQVELPPGYLAEAYRLVRADGGVCIADEVQVGFGRLGTHFWGFETQAVTPDIVVLGKPIGNGFPLAAVVTTPAMAQSFDAGMEFFSTFGGNPVACAAGLAVLEVLEGEGLMANAREVGAHLKEGLVELASRTPLIGDVRGRGLFLGVELVRDRETLEPAGAEAEYLVNRMRELGILCGTDGPHHNVLKIRPPLCFSTTDADLLVAVLDQVLGESPLRT